MKHKNINFDNYLQHQNIFISRQLFPQKKANFKNIKNKF